MKTLALLDTSGSGASFELCLPEDMRFWTVREFFRFFEQPLSASRRSGFLADSPDRLRHETLRRIITWPASTFHRPVLLVQKGVALALDDVIDTAQPYTEILLERDAELSSGNPRALSLKACNQAAFAGCREELLRIVDHLFNFSQTIVITLSGSRVESFVQCLESFHSRLDHANQLKVLFRLAEIVYAHPFENITKLMSGAPFCSGWEMWGRMRRGHGGICAEKAGALKFIYDVLGVETFYVAGSSHIIPDDYERQLKIYLYEEGNAPQPVWIQHLLLGFKHGESEYLTDVSNGNVPFLFLEGQDVHRLIKRGYRSRMVYEQEELTLARISTWAGDALLTLSEFHLPNLAYQYIFDQSLGLQISSKAFLSVFHDWGTEQSALYQQHFTTMAFERHLPMPRFYAVDNMSALPDQNLQKLLMKVRAALHEQCPQPYYTGDYTFVLQPLNQDRWTAPRISQNVRDLITNTE